MATPERSEVSCKIHPMIPAPQPIISRHLNGIPLRSNFVAFSSWTAKSDGPASN
ncbi:hypothetical protein FTUN_6473 [Frigoriglobus tundricola]|uniref:Uncharacterized protein n=1 Tax=Frigoriglobus tundricola TaxID=2774151 RepID=A0A6M5YYD0_9BACT|nr:hypothetical protein FTUN_6473 [Frigoriglobus tundricola]